MRTLLIIFCLVFLAGACSQSGSKSSDRQKTGVVNYPEENLKLVRLDISGMSCEGCEKAIVGSINKLEGIQEASASYTAGEAVVKYDSTKTSLEDISQAVADAGYSVVGEKGGEAQDI